ncbi:MAG: primosomal protein N' [Gammaproteobacteria bacterium]|nr:MAG: primosomal protein N' [Gammaproteobacteria bacterium]
MNNLILRIAVPSPLYRSFDYLQPAGIDATALPPGIRVQVPFGRRTVIGILLAVATESDFDTHKLKRALEILDDTPVISDDVLAMTLWASDYYHHPVGHALSAAMPALLRQGRQPTAADITSWRMTQAGRAVEPTTLNRAVRQAKVMAQLRAHPRGISRSAIDAPASVLHALADKGWLEICHLDEAHNKDAVVPSTHKLNPAQQLAVESIAAQSDHFKPFLLAGVTGSGKTEVYLQLIEAALARQQQALVLVPEIGLTPQLVARFRQRFPVSLALLHSGLTDHERLAAWQQARSGQAPIIIGTRSAIFTPMARPGLIVVDEEHDASLKQQDGFRYSARDLAIWRARQLDIPVVLGSATPSLESLLNVEQSRYQQLDLPERAGVARPPTFQVLDVRKQALEDGLSPPLLEHIRRHLEADGQVLLFLNRRGFAPTLMCYDCDWVAECHRCDARMTWHQRDHQLHCHHCGNQRPVDSVCPACQGSDLHPQGQGTERVEQALEAHFPNVKRVRIDRDTTRRKGELDRLLEQARCGEGRLLLGTQMLAKGHHFPDVTLVGILDADHGLFSTDFRASERMAQLIVQVAGRAGRHERPGEVIIQTCHPDHPLLQLLINQGYPAFAHAALAERKDAQMPPVTRMALLRAEAPSADTAMSFLESVAERINATGIRSVETWGPVPATMERRAGRYRAQLVLQSSQLGELQRLLSNVVRQLETAKEARRVRWSVDVDPADTY